MQAETITPINEKEWLELRTKDITSTEISALFGISPYCTEFELWHRKKSGDIVQIEENEFMKWGKRLQDSIAYGIAEDNAWSIRRMDEYMRDPVLRMGASFDFSIEPETILTSNPPKPGPSGLLEIKNVFGMKFREEWLEDDAGNIEAPPHIEIQVQHQLAVSGLAFAYIAALIDGNKVVLLKRVPDPYIIDAIKAKVVKFWQSIEDNVPPCPNFERDADFISRLYGFAEPNKLFNAHGDAKIETLAVEHRELGASIKQKEIRRDAIKAEILTLIGDSEKVAADGFSISAGVVGPAEVSYHRDGYRMFRINWPRSKKNG